MMMNADRTGQLKRHARHTAIAAAMVIAVGAAGTALGFWTAPATGSSSAGLGTLTITAETITDETPSSALVPGGTSDLVIKVTNPGKFAVRLHDLSVGKATVDTPGCSGDAVSTSASRSNPFIEAFFDASEPLEPGATRVVHVPDVVSLDEDAPQHCQAATFTFPVTVDALTVDARP
jgi:hypothetical protein